MRNLVLMLCMALLMSGCGKKQKESAKTDSGGATGNTELPVVDDGRVVGGKSTSQATLTPQPPTDTRNTNSRPGGTQLGNTYRAGKRAALLTEMGQIGTIVTQGELEYTRMPTAADIKAMLETYNPKYARLVDDGTIILTNTTDKAGMWAYEVDSDKAGGIALVGGRANRYSAEQIVAMLKR